MPRLLSAAAVERVLRIERERLLVARDGFVEAALLRGADAEVVPGLEGIRLERDHAPEGLLGLGVLARARQAIAEPEVEAGRRVVDRSASRYKRIASAQIAGVAAQISELRERRRKIGVRRQRHLRQMLGARAVAPHRSDPRQAEQRIGVALVQGERLLELGDGFVEPAFARVDAGEVVVDLGGGCLCGRAGPRRPAFSLLALHVPERLEPRHVLGQLGLAVILRRLARLLLGLRALVARDVAERMRGLELRLEDRRRAPCRPCPCATGQPQVVQHRRREVEHRGVLDLRAAADVRPRRDEDPLRLVVEVRRAHVDQLFAADPPLAALEAVVREHEDRRRVEIDLREQPPEQLVLVARTTRRRRPGSARASSGPSSRACGGAYFMNRCEKLSTCS